MIVTLPNKAIVTPKTILKPPKYVVESENDTIAARVKARQQMQNNPPAVGSIADRVAQCQREVANTVLDHETGELLEYRRLLKHPRFKEVWTKSAADEFGRLANGIGGQIKGTNIIEFIHKHEVPQTGSRT